MVRSRLIRLLVAGVLLTGAAGGSAVWWRQSRPVVPAVLEEGLEPDVAAAFAAARRQVEREPKSAAAWGRYGMVLYAHGRLAECEPVFAAAQRLDPDDPRWPYFRGLAARVERPDDAVESLREALRCSPRNATVRLRLAELLLELDRLDQAEPLFRELAFCHSASPRARLGLGQVLARRGRWREALDPLWAAADDPISRRAARTALAEAYFRLGRFDESEAERRQVAALPPDLPWPDPYVSEAGGLQAGPEQRIERASQLFERGARDDGVALIQELIRDHPESVQAHLTLGKMQLELGQAAPAEEALQQALALNRHSAEAHFLLAIARLSRGDNAGAEESLNRAVAEKPTYGLAHYHLGECRLKRGDRAGAAAAFRDALRSRPDLAAAQLALGELLLAEGKRAEALPHLQNALKLEPGNDRAKALLEQTHRSRRLPKP
ncbi:MAG: tetratricopeptide repeat protein [Gemmataceae bacterium]